MGLALSKKVHAYHTKRQIQSVHISDVCQRSYPCKHTDTVTYSDGEVDPMHLNGVEILKKFSSFFTPEQRSHFQVYESVPEKI